VFSIGDWSLVLVDVIYVMCVADEKKSNVDVQSLIRAVGKGRCY